MPLSLVLSRSNLRIAAALVIGGAALLLPAAHAQQAGGTTLPKPAPGEMNLPKPVPLLNNLLMVQAQKLPNNKPDQYTMQYSGTALYASGNELPPLKDIMSQNGENNGLGIGALGFRLGNAVISPATGTAPSVQYRVYAAQNESGQPLGEGIVPATVTPGKGSLKNAEFVLDNKAWKTVNWDKVPKVGKEYTFYVLVRPVISAGPPYTTVGNPSTFVTVRIQPEYTKP